MNLLRNTTALALALCENYITENSVAVDATCGRGNDTLWLAKRCRKVYAFDIQQEAVESTNSLLEAAGETGEVICDSHNHIDCYVKEAPDVIVFNLGYLPGGDKNVTTKAEETLLALGKSLELLAVDGILSVTMYPGHPQGACEQELILAWAKELDKSKFHCVFANMLNQPDGAPQILWITKKK